VRQALAGALLVAHLQGIADPREVVTELPESQRDVEHRHVPEHGQRPANPPQECGVHGQHERGRHQHRQAPGHPAMVRLARIKIAADRERPGAQASMDRVAARQRTRLLDQQREQDGEKTHGLDHTGQR
jgi:hypothetical protein